jgi:hypothetical protein
VGTKPSLVAGAWYYICVWSQSTGGATRIYDFDSGGSGLHYKILEYNGYPDSITFIAGAPNAIVCIYCTYTEEPVTETTFNTMTGTSTGWSWATATIDTDKCPRSPTQNGLGWIWGTVSDTSTSYIPSGSATGWVWIAENS